MLYYILPPIVIILSTATLIFFLFRKVSQFPEDEVMQSNKEVGIFATKMRKIPSIFGQFGLKMLEKMMQRFKLLSLKIHNITNVWFHSIRKKREKSMIENVENFKKENDDNIKDISIKQKTFFTRNEKQRLREGETRYEIQKDLTEKPIVRSKITYPSTQRSARMQSDIIMRSKPIKPIQQEKKDQLEDILIRRIAINPKDIEAYERLGDYYLEQMNLRDALECYRQVLKLSPTHQKAKTKVRRIEESLE